ncbi:TPA: single-stranded DNA-binding protein [Klebsiella michiganensis]|nr:single-stranded DNA-binding protein [Klebsiella variicola]HDX9094975.1 single-stranded DNA-binding protein [Klebsiella michiganensis]
MSNGEATFWLGVIAFGKQADALAKLSKGYLVSVAGNMQHNHWTSYVRNFPSGRRGSGSLTGICLHV